MLNQILEKLAADFEAGYISSEEMYKKMDVYVRIYS